MGNCCDEPKREAQNENAASHALCPRCGASGRAVGDATIQALLGPGQASSLLSVERRFCKTPTCDVLYYGADGRFAGKTAAVAIVDLQGQAKDQQSRWLIEGARERPVSIATFQSRLVRVAGDMPFAEPLTTHRLRHSFAR